MCDILRFYFILCNTTNLHPTRGTRCVCVALEYHVTSTRMCPRKQATTGNEQQTRHQKGKKNTLNRMCVIYMPAAFLYPYIKQLIISRAIKCLKRFKNIVFWRGFWLYLRWKTERQSVKSWTSICCCCFFCFFDNK